MSFSSAVSGLMKVRGRSGGGGGVSLVKECRLSDGGRCEGVCAFPCITVDILGGGLILGKTPRLSPDPCQAKSQQVDKCYSHMKTEWISRLNFLSRGHAYGHAGLHCSTPAKHCLWHSNISLGCFKIEKSEKFQPDLPWYFMFCQLGLNHYLAGFTVGEGFGSILS